MSFSTQDSDEVLSEMNVTPLVDVMLVLLVVFIVTAPLMTNAIKVNLPKTDAVAPAEKKDPVVVSVDQDGKFYLAKTELARNHWKPASKRSRPRTAKCACSCRPTPLSITARWPRPWRLSNARALPKYR